MKVSYRVQVAAYTYTMYNPYVVIPAFFAGTACMRSVRKTANTRFRPVASDNTSSSLGLAHHANYMFGGAFVQFTAKSDTGIAAAGVQRWYRGVQVAVRSANETNMMPMFFLSRFRTTAKEKNY